MDALNWIPRLSWCESVQRLFEFCIKSKYLVSEYLCMQPFSSSGVFQWWRVFRLLSRKHRGTSWMLWASFLSSHKRDSPVASVCEKKLMKRVDFSRKPHGRKKEKKSYIFLLRLKEVFAQCVVSPRTTCCAGKRAVFISITDDKW